MEIDSDIDYWGDGFLTYNPDKIRDLLFEYFPEAVFDKTNYARQNIETFFEKAEQQNYNPPDFVIDARWKIAFQNGPVYKYEIPLDENRKIDVMLKRFSINFRADFDFDDETEFKIIEFLKLLKYGTIMSDRQTKNFVEAVEDRNRWKLSNE